MPDVTLPDLPALAGYVGRGEDTTDPEGYLGRCLTEASGMVTDHIGDVKVPHYRIYRAVLEVAAELYYRRQARGGIAMFSGGEHPTPVRIARDPMKAAYDILAPYLPGGFA